MKEIIYDHKIMDYRIEGRPLLQHLAIHEGITANEFVPAFLTQSTTHDRLCMKNSADLAGDHIAIYTCSHCGGYDGGCIGVKITFEHDKIIWHDIGIYEDFNEGEQQPFKKVRQYDFSRSAYQTFLSEVKIHQATS